MLCLVAALNLQVLVYSVLEYIVMLCGEDMQCNASHSGAENGASTPRSPAVLKP